MAKITVVIPAYNAADTIRSCLDSVCQQSRSADEVIVVDDGSSDNTSTLVSSYGDKVKLLLQKNQGSAKARQTGSDAASGDYIAYLDSDDWWLDDHLLKVEHALNSATVDFLFTDLRRASPMAPASEYSEKNSSFYPWFKDSYLSKTLAVDDVHNLYKFSQKQSLNILLKGFPIYPSTMVVSRNALRTIGEWDIRFRRCQDFDFSLRIARKFGIFYFDDVHTVLGLHDVNSDARAYILMQTLGDIKVLETHLSENQNDRAYSKSLKYALSSKLYRLGKRYMDQGDYKNAIDALTRSASFSGKRTKALIRLLLSSFFILKKPLGNLKK